MTEIRQPKHAIVHWYGPLCVQSAHHRHCRCCRCCCLTSQQTCFDYKTQRNVTGSTTMFSREKKKPKQKPTTYMLLVSSRCSNRDQHKGQHRETLENRQKNSEEEEANRRRRRAVLWNLSSHKTADMSHIAHEQGSALVSNGPHASEIPVSGIRTSTGDDHLRPEIQSLLLQLIVINESSLVIHLVRQALEEDRSGGNLLAAGGVVTMSEMTTRRQIQSHDTIMRLQQRSVNREVGWRSGIRLHVNAPFGSIQTKRLERSFLAQILDLVDELVPAVVTSAWKTFRVLISERTSQSFDHCLRREILGSDKLNPPTLPHFLPLNQIKDLLIYHFQRLISPLLHRRTRFHNFFSHTSCSSKFPLSLSLSLSLCLCLSSLYNNAYRNTTQNAKRDRKTTSSSFSKFLN